MPDHTVTVDASATAFERGLMDIEVAIMRILHIVPGMFWVGSAVFVAFILNPRLRALGPELERPVTAAVNRVIALVVTGAAVITILVGFTLMTRTPGRGFGDLFDTGWGWAMGIGILASIVALGFGAVTGMSQARIRRINQPETSVFQLDGLERRVRIYEKMHAVFAVLAVGTMAVARYV